MRRESAVRVLAVLAASVWAWAQPAAFDLTPQKQAQIEQLIASEMARKQIPGLSMAIGVGRDVRWKQGFGMADLENLLPMTSRSMLRLGSIAKPITAVAVLQLMEDRKMNLDVPVQRYLPKFPDKPWPVTIRHLLDHQSGIRHYQGDEISLTRHYSDRMTPLKIFENDPLLFEPGTKFSYTTYGYNVLGAAVEAAAGQPFMDYLRDQVFQPARMTFIEDDNHYRIIPGRARGYRLADDGRLVNCGLADTSYKIPGGGMIARAEELVKFALALNNNQILKKETVQAMWTPQKLNNGSLTGWGLGWAVETIDGRKRAGHTGGQQGITTHLVIYPAEGLSIALMANLEQVRIAELTNAIGKIVLDPGRPQPVPAKPQ
jgi:CubicO group peptidase (beta-lactamase class C family)